MEKRAVRHELGRSATIRDVAAVSGVSVGTVSRSLNAPDTVRTATLEKVRAAIQELMSISQALRRMIQSGARAEELQRQALGEGMLTLRQDGLEKVLAGLTTLDEVRAVSN